MEILVPLFVVFFMANMASSDPQRINVMSYGAVGDGVTDDSKAFGKAWDSFCGSKTDRSTLQVPEGKTFLLKPVKFNGPCKPSYLHIKMDGNLTAPTKPWDVTDDDSTWIKFVGVDGLVLNGSAHINGQGLAWWEKCSAKAHGNCHRPTALKFTKCTNLQVWGLKSFDTPRNHISLSGCVNVTISNMYLSAPKTSPNTDGIDISESTNVRIQKSIISTGDDCIAINGGSSNINITGVKCGPGHGISIGSLGRKGSHETVEGVHVFNCTFVGTQNGARIKTWQGGSGYARNIKFENIVLESVNKSIFIDQFYCPHKSCDDKGSAVKISSVSFRGFAGTSLDGRAITLNCSRTVGCADINLKQINITAATPGKEPRAVCFNAHGTSTAAFPPVDCLLP